MDFLGVDMVALFRVTVISLPCGSAVVLASVLPVFWLFCYCSLLFRVSPLLSAWGLPFISIVQRLSC